MLEFSAHGRRVVDGGRGAVLDDADDGGREVERARARARTPRARRDGASVSEDRVT